MDINSALHKREIRCIMLLCGIDVVVVRHTTSGDVDAIPWETSVKRANWQIKPVCSFYYVRTNG